MKKTNINQGLLAFLTLAAGVLSPASVFATNPYNINYTGGAELGADNVTINPTLINSLTPLIKESDGSNLKFSSSSKWETGGYVQWDDRCDPIQYIKIWNNRTRSSITDDISYSITGEKYVSNIKIKNIVTEDLPDVLAENEDNMTVGVNKYNGWLFVGFEIFEDAQCTTKKEGIKNLKTDDGGKIFVETEISLSKKGETTPFASDELYFGITDIDQAQSYKILNHGGDLLSKNNMFAVSATSLQPIDDTLKNMFVESGHYIYSQYNETHVNNVDGSNVLVKIDTDSQADGLEVVYGFVKQAGSGINYYAKQYVVSYKSDENGSVTGIKNENVISGLNPTGSTVTPNKNYAFEYWTADVDVNLTDGTTIKAGEKLTPAQIKKVVVNQDIVFTGFNATESKIIAPDTGYFTGEQENASFIFGIILPVSVTLTLAAITIINRKKHTVGFKK